MDRKSAGTTLFRRFFLHFCDWEMVGPPCRKTDKKVELQSSNFGNQSGAEAVLHKCCFHSKIKK